MTSEDQVEYGTVKAYLPLKGFGFIQREKGKDVFFFRTDAPAEEDLYEGITVKFNVSIELKGPRARNIVRVG